MREPAKTLPFKQQSKPESQPRWTIGVDRQRVGVYVALALILGFGLGFAVLRFLTANGKAPIESARVAGQPPQGLEARAPSNVAVPALISAASGELHKVTRIIRADTVEVEGIGPVRMIGVETPDGKEPHQIYEAHGRNALAFTEKLLLGRDVRVEFDPAFAPRNDKDDTGQTLSYIYTQSGLLFNSELIRQGHGFVRVAEPFRLIEEFRVLERDAMQAMRGVWGLSGSSPVTASTQPPAASRISGSSGRKLTPLLPSEIDPRPSASASVPPISAEPYVVVSSADRMYHKDNCPYVSKRKHALSLSQARSEGYSACSRCFASTVLKAP